jgi:hypothetical protein
VGGVFLVDSSMSDLAVTDNALASPFSRRHRLRILEKKESAPDDVVQISNLLTVTGQQQEHHRFKYVYASLLLPNVHH